MATRIERLTSVALRVAPNEAQRLLALTMAIGVVCGLVAVAFHEAIHFAESALLAVSTQRRGWYVWMLVVPTGGGLVAGALLTRFFPEARGSGVPQVKASYAGKRSRVRLRDSVAKFFLAAMQIGSGASLGREGPTVQICAGVATALGRLARVSPQAQRKLLPVGAAAGIAAAFNAPIAAVTFTIEEIIGKLDETLLSGVIVAAALAAVIERSILGTHPVFDVPGNHTLDDARSLLVYAVLGVAAAALSIVFTDVLLGLRGWFATRRLPEWARPAVGGFGTGAVAVATMLLVGATGIAGGGYDTLRTALSGNLGLRVMLVLSVAKLLATCLSYSSGGAGGLFAPVLFMGAMLGGAFGWLDVALFHHPPTTAAAFALVGMGAAFSGAIRAPMTSVLIIVEMTSGYGLILPLMIANMTAYVIARRYRPEPLYDALLAQDGIRLDEDHFAESLERFRVEDVVTSDRAFVTFEHDVRADELLRIAREPSWQTVFPVVDHRGRAVGIITNEELRFLVSEPELLTTASAADLMRPAMMVNVQDSLRGALQRIRAERVRELPVVDENDRVIGFLDEGALAHLYLEASPPPTVRAAR